MYWYNKILYHQINVFLSDDPDIMCVSYLIYFHIFVINSILSDHLKKKKTLLNR